MTHEAVTRVVVFGNGGRPIVDKILNPINLEAGDEIILTLLEDQMTVRHTRKVKRLQQQMRRLSDKLGMALRENRELKERLGDD